ncbi:MULTISPECIES: hypothetical protein [Bacillus cereus group]|uniref:hypothetical protein n=1 Tax=Bacillus cereus group TaxID=86661 RepID=UPI0014833077|nr:hypothetical protein [Bacillus cereus]
MIGRRIKLHLPQLKYKSIIDIKASISGAFYFEKGVEVMNKNKSIIQVNNKSLETKVEHIKGDGKSIKSLINQDVESIIVKW